MKLYLKIETPSTRLRGNYETSGQLFMLQANTRGKFNMKLCEYCNRSIHGPFILRAHVVSVGFTQTVEMKLTRINKNGVTYLQIDNITYDYHVEHVTAT